MEPGKILHELRMGELTQLGLKPHSPYYGSADSTPLWLILLSEYWRWTGDEKLVGSLRDNALAALAWIDESGDRDGDGYVEYGTRSSQGLGNQCWRDSFDGVLFADGTIPYLPIATAEIQGYVYDAKLRMAELADGPYRRRRAGRPPAERGGRPARALRARLLDRRARRLLRHRARRRQATDRLADLEHRPAALDGHRVRGASRDRGRPVHVRPPLLGLGRPDAVDRRRRLQSDRLPPRHGLAARQLAHRPRPGPLRLPRRGEPDRDGAARRGGVLRLPAAGGVLRLPAIARPASRSPTRPPAARRRGRPGRRSCFLRAMLGLEARDGQVTLDPALPDEIGRVSITGLRAFGTRWDVEANGRTGHVRLAREG